MPSAEWRSLRETLESADLLVPPYLELRFPEIRQVREWAWGTDDFDTGRAYVFEGPKDWLAGQRSERFRLCHSGHGANSYAITAEIVTARAAVMVQVGWGGAYMDDESSTAAVNLHLSWAAELSALVDAQESWPDGTAMLVAVSEMRNWTKARVLGHLPSGGSYASGPEFADIRELIIALTGTSIDIELELDSFTRPDNREWAAKARASLYRGRPFDAAVEFAKSTELEPYDASLWHELGRVQDELGDLASAMQFISIAASLDPGRRLYREAAARLLARGPVPYSALATLEQALREDRRNATYANWWADAFAEAALAELPILPDGTHLAMTRAQARKALELCEQGLIVPATDPDIRSRLKDIAAAQTAALGRRWRFSRWQTIGIVLAIIQIPVIVGHWWPDAAGIGWVGGLVGLVWMRFAIDLDRAARSARRKFGLPRSFGRQSAP